MVEIWQSLFVVIILAMLIFQAWIHYQENKRVARRSRELVERTEREIAEGKWK